MSSVFLRNFNARPTRLTTPSLRTVAPRQFRDRSHCRSEIPPTPGFLGNCRGATVPTPAGGLPRSISVATEIDFGGSLFAPAPNSPPLFLRLFTLIVVPAAGTTMSVKTYARRLYSLGFFTKRQPGLRVPMSDAPPRWSVRQTPLPLRPTSIPTRAAFIP